MRKSFLFYSELMIIDLFQTVRALINLFLVVSIWYIIFFVISNNDIKMDLRGLCAVLL